MKFITNITFSSCRGMICKGHKNTTPPSPNRHLFQTNIPQPRPFDYKLEKRLVEYRPCCSAIFLRFLLDLCQGIIGGTKVTTISETISRYVSYGLFVSRNIPILIPLSII